MITRLRITCTALIIACLGVAVLAQNEPRKVGSIDFFGYSGLNLEQIRSALPLRAGDKYPGPSATISAINKAVTGVIGRPPTDVTPVCCDAGGNYLIYVGLPGTTIKQQKFNPVPTGQTQFPTEIVQLYEQTMAASSAAVMKGDAREDTSKGYSLSLSDPALRAKQMEVRAYALRNEKLINAVLDSANDARQRIVAAYLLGYVRQSLKQISYLVKATQDADETVRNNATRALSLLAESSPRVAAQIPAGDLSRCSAQVPGAIGTRLDGCS